MWRCLIMKCEHCGKEFSNKVFNMHINRCVEKIEKEEIKQKTIESKVKYKEEKREDKKSENKKKVK